VLFFLPRESKEKNEKKNKNKNDFKIISMDLLLFKIVDFFLYYFKIKLEIRKKIKKFRE
jgi:hypothetical protein